MYIRPIFLPAFPIYPQPPYTSLSHSLPVVTSFLPSHPISVVCSPSLEELHPLTLIVPYSCISLLPFLTLLSLLLLLFLNTIHTSFAFLIKHAASLANNYPLDFILSLPYI